MKPGTNPVQVNVTWYNSSDCSEESTLRSTPNSNITLGLCMDQTTYWTIMGADTLTQVRVPFSWQYCTC